MFFYRDPMQYFYSILAVFVVLPVHEWAHGYVAYLLGDHTAKWQGRLSLNPMKHLTWMGSLCLLFCGFGWAKPVPINPYNFTKVKDIKTGFLICALAGPLANFVMAFICMALYKILILVSAPYFLINMLYALVVINISLMVFNLLPVPPLDGSRIWSVLLKDEAYHKLLMNEQKIIFVVFLLAITGLINIPISILTKFFVSFLNLATRFIG